MAFRSSANLGSERRTLLVPFIVGSEITLSSALLVGSLQVCSHTITFCLIRKDRPVTFRQDTRWCTRTTTENILNTLSKNAQRRHERYVFSADLAQWRERNAVLIFKLIIAYLSTTGGNSVPPALLHILKEEHGLHEGTSLQYCLNLLTFL